VLLRVPFSTSWTVSEPTADALLTKGPDDTPELIYPFTFLLQILEKQEPTSGLEPLTCSLRVL
jgi:hypothetical protein